MFSQPSISVLVYEKWKSFIDFDLSGKKELLEKLDRVRRQAQQKEKFQHTIKEAYRFKVVAKKFFLLSTE